MQPATAEGRRQFSDCQARRQGNHALVSNAFSKAPQPFLFPPGAAGADHNSQVGKSLE
jgi:hypothetical protein